MLKTAAAGVLIRLIRSPQVDARGDGAGPWRAARFRDGCGMTQKTAIPLRATVLDAPGLTHGFFTRQGGVSTGVYASLNGGVGSQDDPRSVAENRRRMAAMSIVKRNVPMLIP